MDRIRRLFCTTSINSCLSPNRTTWTGAVIQSLNRLRWLSPEVSQFWSSLSAATPNSVWIDALLKLHGPATSKSLDFAAGLDATPVSKLLVTGLRPVPLNLVAVLVVGQIFQPNAALSRRTALEIELQQFELGAAAEFLYLSQQLHAGVPVDNPMASVEQELKVRTLAGDFYITKLFSCLARIQHAGVMRVMMECLARCAEQNFDGKCENYPELVLSCALKCASMLAGSSEADSAAAERMGQVLSKLSKVDDQLLRTSDQLLRTSDQPHN